MDARTETLTIRMPRTLKKSVEILARGRAMTMTGMVREALEDSLRSTAQPVRAENPGLTPAFDHFVAHLRKQKRPCPVIFLVADSRERRYFFEGFVDFDLTNETLLAMQRRKGATSWIIPRRDVVGWHQGEARNHEKLALALQEQGWAGRSELDRADYAAKVQ